VDILEETLNSKQQYHAELTTDQLKLIVMSSQNELENLIQLLQELEGCREVLDQDFAVSDLQKSNLNHIAIDDTATLVNQNHSNLFDIISECNQYYECLSKLFAGYHYALQKFERNK
jgi:hypothetical protein